MRGFNLFTAFLGVAMIMLSVALAIHVNKVRSEEIERIQNTMVRTDLSGVADAIKSDVYNSVLNDIRKSFQSYFEENPLEPPEDVWESKDTFKRWFEENFAKSDTLASWVAHLMVSKLQTYIGGTFLGEEYEVGVIGSDSSTAEALKAAASVRLLDDGTFVYVIDTKNLSPETYNKLPKIFVSKRGESSGILSDVVLPRGLWTLPIPLRVGRAYDVAKTVYEYMNENERYKYISLAEGHCYVDNPAICGVFTVEDGKFDPISPKKSDDLRYAVVSSGDGAKYRGSIVAPCTYQTINMKEDMKTIGVDVDSLKKNLEKIYREQLKELENQLNNAKDEEEKTKIGEEIDYITSLLDDLAKGKLDSALQDYPCGDNYDQILPLLNAVAIKDTQGALVYLQDAFKDLEIDSDHLSILPYLEYYERHPTARVVQRTAINIGKIICQEATGLPGLLIGIVLKAAGISSSTDICNEISRNSVVSDILSKTTISYDPCTLSGTVYCLAPSEYAYVVRWVDSNKDYWMDPDEPPLFNIVVKHGSTEVNDTMEEIKKEVENVSVGEKEKSDSEQREICNETWAEAKKQFPLLLTGCINQYVSFQLKCGQNKDDNVVNYILYGDQGTQASNNPLKDMCNRLYERVDANNIGNIPGIFHGKNYIISWVCKGFTELAESSQTEINSTVNPDGSRNLEDYKVCFTDLTAENKDYVVLDDQKVVEVNIGGSLWAQLDNTDRDAVNQEIGSLEADISSEGWYCDEFAPKKGILDKIKNAFKKAASKLKGIADKFNNLICPHVTTIDVCRKGIPSPKDFVKTSITAPATIACTLGNALEAKSAKEAFAEYNSLYHSRIFPEIEELLQRYNTVGGECNDIAHAIYRQFAPPQNTNQGPTATDLSVGSCHPDHMLDQALQMARMVAASKRCQITGNPKRVLYETTWLHIGTEIYATCSAEAPRP